MNTATNRNHSAVSFINGASAATRFPCEPGRYTLITVDYSQSPSTDDRGTFSDFDGALSEALSLVGPSADKASILDNFRGYTVCQVRC